MTREKAINFLRSSGMSEEQINTVVDALNPKGDLINRQDAIYALTEANLKSHMDSVEGGQENRSAIRIIMELPSAERKRGEWIKEDSGAMYCTACGKYPLFASATNYCPNCGATMKEVEE